MEELKEFPNKLKYLNILDNKNETIYYFTIDFGHYCRLSKY